MGTIYVLRKDTNQVGSIDADEYAASKDLYRPVTPQELELARANPEGKLEAPPPSQLEESRQQSLTPFEHRQAMHQAVQQGLNWKDWAGNLKAGIRDNVWTQALPFPEEVKQDSRSNLNNVLENFPGAAPRLRGGMAPERELPIIGSASPWRAFSNLLSNYETPVTAGLETLRKRLPEAERAKDPLDTAAAVAKVPVEYAYQLVRHFLWPSARGSVGSQARKTVEDLGTWGYQREPALADRLRAAGLGTDLQRRLPVGMYEPTLEEKSAAYEKNLEKIAPPAGTPEQTLLGMTPRTAEVLGDVASLALPVKPFGKLMGAGVSLTKEGAAAAGGGLFRALPAGTQEWGHEVADWFRKGGSMARLPDPADARRAVSGLIRSEVASDVGAARIADDLDRTLTTWRKQLGRPPTKEEAAAALATYEALPDAAAGLAHPNPLVRLYAEWETGTAPRYAGATGGKILEGDRVYARHEWTGEREAEEAMKRLGVDPTQYVGRGATAAAATGNPLAVDTGKRRWLNERINELRAARGEPPVPDTVGAMNAAARQEFGLTFDLFSTDPRAQAAYRMKQERQIAAAGWLQQLAREFGVPLRGVPEAGISEAERAGQFGTVWPKPYTADRAGSRYVVPNIPAWPVAVRGGERIAVPKEIADYLERTANVERAAAGGGVIGKLAEGFTGSAKGGLLHEWTGLATIARPGYHFRNRLNNLTSIYERFGGAESVPGTPGWLAARDLAKQIRAGTEPAWLKPYADEARQMGLLSAPGAPAPTEISWPGAIPSLRLRRMGPFAGEPYVQGGVAQGAGFLERWGPTKARVPFTDFRPVEQMGELARGAEEMDRAHAVAAAARQGMTPEEAVRAVQETLYSRYAYPEGVRALRMIFPFGGWQWSNLNAKLGRLSTPGAARMGKAGLGVERLSEDVALDDQARNDVRTRPLGPFASQGPKVYLGTTPVTHQPIYVNNPGAAYGEPTDAMGVLAPWWRYLSAKSGLVKEPVSFSDPMVDSSLSGMSAMLSRANPAISQWAMMPLNYDPKRQRSIFYRAPGAEGEGEGIRAQFEKAGRGSAAVHWLLEQAGAVKPGEELPLLGTLRPTSGEPLKQSLVSKRALDVWPSPFGSATEIVNPESEVPAWAALAAFLAGGTAGTIDFEQLQQGQNAADRANASQTRQQEGITGPIPSWLLRMRKRGGK